MPQGTVLITGSSGFIGSHVVAEAIKNGYKVKGLDIAEPKQKAAR